MLTRRVRGRRFLLRPSKRTNQLIRYVVAVMVHKWSVRLHAITALSNHWHVCISDPLGNVVEFQRDCHAFIARALNATHGEFEAVWASDGTSRVTCEEPEDLIDKIAYTVANPVEAGLVRFGTSWPGVRHAWPCKPRSIRRPAKFFRGDEEGGVWPETATLELARPPGFDDMTDDELAARVQATVDRREEQLRRAADARKDRFLGRKAVLAQRRHARPASFEPRFGLSPGVACRNKWRRIERLAVNRQWQIEYDDAKRRWVAGARDVLFPAGTYKMRVVHRVACARPPS
jgi:hypothetical protein